MAQEKKYKKVNSEMHITLEKPIVVISAVNLNEGGPLSILKDAVNAFISNFISDYKLVLLIHNKKLLPDIKANDKVEIQEYTYPKKTWILRVWFEYVHSYFISKKIEPCLWFSLQDLTPNVICKYKVVYCQNPVPFYQLSFKEIAVDKSIFFFHFFYNFFYRINIKSNKYVIVQQQWLREEFIKKFKIKNVVVAHPDVNIPVNTGNTKHVRKKFRFFYPALPRVFKNFEVLLNAAERLQYEYTHFEIIITFEGNENRYASMLFKKFKHLSCIKFIGIQKREAIWDLYNETDCLVFASKLETWGLPITEMKLFNKPILIANCKYARETIGNYNKVCFFDSGNSLQLSHLMKQAINNLLLFNSYSTVQPQPPFAQDWKDLYQLILYNRQSEISQVSTNLPAQFLKK